MSEIEETAKTTGKAIDAAREAGGFLAQFLKGPLTQLSGMSETYLRYVRACLELGLVEKFKKKLEQRGLTGPTRHVPFKLVMSILREASEEEDDELQDRWAQLLVNAADKDSGISVEPMYISILKDLSPQDAWVLDVIYRLVEFTYPEGKCLVIEGTPDNCTVEVKEPPKVSPSPELQLVLSNLKRLGLIEFDTYWHAVMVPAAIRRTVLGHKFFRACSARQTKPT